MIYDTLYICGIRWVLLLGCLVRLDKIWVNCTNLPSQKPRNLPEFENALKDEDEGNMSYGSPFIVGVNLSVELLVCQMWLEKNSP